MPRVGQKGSPSECCWRGSADSLAASREGAGVAGVAHTSLPQSQAAKPSLHLDPLAEVKARSDASAAEAARQWAEAEASARSFVAEFDGAAA